MWLWLWPWLGVYVVERFALPDKYGSIFIWIRWLLGKSNKSVAIKHYQRIWCCKFIHSFHRSYSLTLYQLVDGITSKWHYSVYKLLFPLSLPFIFIPFYFISLCVLCASLHFIARNGSYNAIVCSIQHFVRINFWHFLHHSSIIITYYSNHVNHCRSGYDDVCTIIFFSLHTAFTVAVACQTHRFDTMNQLPLFYHSPFIPLYIYISYFFPVHNL